MKKTIIISLFSIIILLLLFCFLPPYERDELVYQMAVPAYWISHSSIDMQFSHYSYYPWLSFFINYIAIALNLFFLSHLLHFLFALFTAFIIYRSVPDKKAALTVVLIFVTLQPFLRVSYVAYSDFYLLFFATASFVFLTSWFENGRKRDYFMSAIMCGIGLNAKYTMLVFALIMFFLVFWMCYRRYNDLKKTIVQSTAYYSIAVMLFVPFMLKNYYLTGNPLYPFFTGIIPTSNPFQFEPVSHFLFRKVFFNESLWNIILSPFKVFFYGRENDLQWYDGILNPFFLVIPMFGLFIIKELVYRITCIFVLIYMVMVMFLEPVSARFMLPVIPLLAILAGKTLSVRFSSTYVLTAILFISLGINLYSGGHHIFDTLKYRFLTSRITRDEFISLKSPEYNVVQYINSNLLSSSKVLMLFTGHRTFYFKKDFIYDSFNDGRLWSKIINDARTPREMRDNLIKRDITHLFIRKDLFAQYIEDNYNSDMRAVFRSFFDAHSDILFQQDIWCVLTIK